MDILLIKEIVIEIGVPVSLSIVFIWMIIDVYRWIKGSVTKHLAKQTETVGSIANFAGDQLKILESLNGEQKQHRIEIHEYVLEARIKCPWLNTEGGIEK